MKRTLTALIGRVTSLISLQLLLFISVNPEFEEACGTVKVVGAVEVVAVVVVVVVGDVDGVTVAVVLVLEVVEQST